MFQCAGVKPQRTSGGTDLDVESSDSQLLATDSDILSSQHSSVWGRLVTVGLDLHSTSDTSDGFTATGITQKLAYEPHTNYAYSTSIFESFKGLRT